MHVQSNFNNIFTAHKVLSLSLIIHTTEFFFTSLQNYTLLGVCTQTIYYCTMFKLSTRIDKLLFFQLMFVLFSNNFISLNKFQKCYNSKGNM